MASAWRISRYNLHTKLSVALYYLLTYWLIISPQNDLSPMVTQLAPRNDDEAARIPYVHFLVSLYSKSF